MKIAVNCCILFLLPFHCPAQIKTPAFKDKDTAVILPVKSVATQKLSNNINRLAIFDWRDDTTSIGYCFSGMPKRTKRMVFDTAAGIVIKDWFCSYLNVGPQNKWGDQLVIILKKLRLSNEANLRVFENGHQGQAQNGWDEGVSLKIEFYLNKNEVYYPLYRYDSVLSIVGKLPGDAASFLSKAFESASNKLFTLKLNEIPASIRQLTLHDIAKKASKERSVPILIETAYRKGVYKTFDEFRNNAPSVTDFEYKKGKFGDMLYVREGDTEYPDRTAWGFCNGKNIFINSSDLFSELIREGNTFYFKGIKSVTRKARHNMMKTSMLNLATNTGEKRTSYSIDNRYYQVDMETGEVY
jgi:hypothetical protein